MRTIIPYLLTVFFAAAPVPAQPHGTGQGGGAEPSNARSIAPLHRTERSEAFGATGGASCVARIYAKQKYQVDNGEWTPVDLRVRPESRHGFPQVVRGGGYASRFDLSRPERGLRFERDDNQVTYSPAGDWTGRTVRLKHGAEGVKETVVLARGADPTVRWKVETSARMEPRNGGLVFFDAGGREVFRVPRPEAWDAAGREVPVMTVLAGDTLVCALSLPRGAEWPVYLDPTTTIGETDNKTGYLCAVSRTYAGARDTLAASYPSDSDVAAWVGQNHDGIYYRVHRTSLVFDTSSLPDAAMIDSARVMLVTNFDGAGINFDMKLTAAAFTGSWAKSWYNDFPGWTPGSVFGVTALSYTLNSAGCHAVGDTCRFRLNAAGIDSINKGGETRFMLMSARDISNIAPSYSTQERLGFEDDSPCLMVWYRQPIVAPSGFTMTPLDSTRMVCAWNDMSDNEHAFVIVNQEDLSVVATAAANATADTISGLSMNTRHIWSVAAEGSENMREYSAPDTAWTLLSPPRGWQAHILPLSSDTLRVSVDPPVNGTSGKTGIEIRAVSGPGASGSGWLTGIYSFRDGGLNPDSSYVYKIRFRNGGGDSTAWSPDLRYTMKGRAVLTLDLAGDAEDDYTVNSGIGVRDSTVVRVGKSDTGQRLDGFLSFRLPWQVQKGGVDSMFVTLTRTAERSGDTPTVKVRGIPVRDLPPVETLNPGAQDSTGTTVSWTITSAADSKKSPDLRALFRAWQDLAPGRDYPAGFGLKLDGGNPSDGVRAVFLDSSHPSYRNDTRLTVYYTPGAPDTLTGAPASLVLSVLSPDSIRADWHDGVSGEYGYVLLNLPDSSRVAGTDTLAADAGTVTVGGLTPNTVYQWTVQAFATGNARAASGVSARTLVRTPGRPSVSASAPTRLRFILDPRDNPDHTEFAVQDSASGRFVDPGTTPHILRDGPLGEWGWRTFAGWGAAWGDSVTGLGVNERHGLRVKAR